MLDPMTRGDDRVLDISNLRTTDNVPAVFAAGDVVRFTLKRYPSSPDSRALLTKTSADGGVTLAIGDSVGAVHIHAADWVGVVIPQRTVAVYDLELTAASTGAVTTIASGQVDVLPDVTQTPLP